jgi:N-acetylmuramoyl-L-alanine amidase
MTKKVGALLLALITSIPSTTFAESALPLKGRLIVLDAGHAVMNFDGQVINSGKIMPSGAREHKVAFEIALKAGKLLEKKGAQIVYTRPRSDYWRYAYSTVEDNKSRALLANELKAAAFVSIHCDWDPKKKTKGVTTFYGKPNSERLGLAVHRNMLKNLKTKDRKLVLDSYTVLDIAEVPAILVETGFLSNREEGRKLITADYQQRVAQCIASGVATFLAN